jgi:hypothetical protein
MAHLVRKYECQLKVGEQFEKIRSQRDAPAGVNARRRDFAGFVEVDAAWLRQDREERKLAIHREEHVLQAPTSRLSTRTSGLALQRTGAFRDMASSS